MKKSFTFKPKNKILKNQLQIIKISLILGKKEVGKNICINVYCLLDSQQLAKILVVQLMVFDEKYTLYIPVCPYANTVQLYPCITCPIRGSTTDLHKHYKKVCLIILEINFISQARKFRFQLVFPITVDPPQLRMSKPG